MNAAAVSVPTNKVWRALATSLLSGFVATQALAQNSGAVVYTSPPNIHQPPVVETQNRGPSLGPNNARPNEGRGINHISPAPTSRDQYRSTPAPEGPFFLPALLPVLGVPRASSSSRELLADRFPRESAGEPYFMAEGNLAANGLLPEKSAESIVSYRTARLTLLTELRDELNRGPEITDDVRQNGVATLAAAQTPLLLDLEAEAEKIRYDLTHRELMKITADDIGRYVPLKEKPEFKQALAGVRLLLSAAHFKDGFSPDQRRLLEEMAQELRLTIEPDLASSQATFFWPAGARIRIPLDLPPEAARKFAEFQRRKAALKKELRAWLDSEQRQILNFDYTEDFEHLAAAQAPRFVELDALADELRPVLAPRMNAAKPPVTQLPGELVRQVGALADRKAALQRQVQAQLVHFRRQLPRDRIELTQGDDGIAITIATHRSSPEDRASVFAQVNDFNREINARFLALADERDAVRAALTRYRATVAGDQPGVTVDQVAADFLAAHRANEDLARQRDYAAAVFTPGLSPAQRRLLLASAAVESLPDAPPPLLTAASPR